MNKGVFFITGFSLILAGCAKTPVYYEELPIQQETNQVIEVTPRENKAQIQINDMVNDMLSSKTVQGITQQSVPILFVEGIKNKSAEHIDTAAITETVTSALLASGKFNFVDNARVEEVRAQLDFNNDQALVNPGTAIQFGKMVGAQYMLYGNISSFDKGEGVEEDLYYQLSMRLMELETGLIEWTGLTEMKKTNQNDV